MSCAVNSRFVLLFARASTFSAKKKEERLEQKGILIFRNVIQISLELGKGINLVGNLWIQFGGSRTIRREKMKLLDCRIIQQLHSNIFRFRLIIRELRGYPFSPSLNHSKCMKFVCLSTSPHRYDSLKFQMHVEQNTSISSSHNVACPRVV